MSTLSHLDAAGHAHMVDVSAKADSVREAIARAEVHMQATTLRQILDGNMPKGDVLAVARIAGIMATKRTAELIPLCHPLPISHVAIQIEPLPNEQGVVIEAVVRTTGKTGVEMEALTAVTVSALTIYDMCKAVEREMRIEAVRLVAKRGGKSGELRFE